jgi:hypothetical protein
MFTWILRNIIGGQTGKRESAIAVASLWLGGVIAVTIGNEFGRDLAFLAETVRETKWIVGGWFAGAFGLDWVAKQTDIGGPAIARSNPEDGDG